MNDRSEWPDAIPILLISTPLKVSGVISYTLYLYSDNYIADSYFIEKGLHKNM